jgi:hypothetical protein
VTDRTLDELFIAILDDLDEVRGASVDDLVELHARATVAERELAELRRIVARQWREADTCG